MIKETLKKSLGVVLAALLLAGSIPALALAGQDADACEIESCTTEDCNGNCQTPQNNPESELLAPEAVATQQDAVVYTVNFYDYDQTTLLGSFEVEAGETSPTPMPPSREGHAFVKWDKDITDIGEDLDVFAVYREMKSFTVAIQYVFTNGEAALQSYLATVEEGASFVQSVPSPEIAGYTPNHPVMQLDLAAVNSNLLYTVTYSPSSGTPYKVIHHFETTDHTTYGDEVVETFYGTQGQRVVAQTLQTPGFTAMTGTHEGTIAADGSLELHLYYTRNTVALYFETAGGSYLEPLTGRYGTPVDYSGFADPKRDGFDLDGWSSSLPAEFPAEDTVYTAEWTEHAEAPVTIIFWVESPETGEYTIASVDTSQVFETGSQPDFTTFRPQYVSGEGYVGFPRNTGLDAPYLLYKYFPSNVEKSYEENKDLVVKSDGSTVYNMYQDLAPITYTFTFPGTPGSGASSDYDGTDVYLEIDGRQYASGEYKIEAKYAQDVSDRWPTGADLRCYSGMTNEELRPDSWRIGSSLYSMTASVPQLCVPAQYLEKAYMSNGKIDMRLMTYASYVQTATISIDHYHQNIGGGSSYDDDYTLNRNYTRTWTAGSRQSLSPDTGFESLDVPGHVMQNGVITVSYQDGAKYVAYHQRGQYSVVFISNDSAVGRIDDIWFEDVVSNYPGHDFVPQAPANMSDYVFAGWYSSPLLLEAQKVDLSKLTMPASELVVYAKWEAPRYQVGFDLDGGSGQNAAQSITSGGYIAPYDEPTKEGYTFAGWKERGKNVTFRMDNPVVRNLDLVATWTPEQTGEYTVYYRALGSSTNLAEPTVVSGIALNSSQTVAAKTISGYIPDALSKSITINPSSNTLFFYYRPFTSGSYQVKYQTAEGVELLPTVRKTTHLSVVTESHVPISGYYPVQAQLTHQMSQNQLENVLVFTYVPYEHALYTVNHYQQGLDWNYSLATTQHFTAEKNRYITVAPQSYQGFTYNRAVSAPSGTVDPGGSLVLNLYYDRYTYAITFVAGEGGSLQGVASYPSILGGTNFGRAVSIPTPVPNEGYRFVGWSPELPNSESAVYANASYTALFEDDEAADEDDGAPVAGGAIVPSGGGNTGSGNDGSGGPSGLFDQLFSGNVPLASFDGSHWSLVNLILTALCGIAALVLFVRGFGKLRVKDANNKAEEDAGATSVIATATVQNEDGENTEQADKKQTKRRFNLLRILSIVLGLAPVLLFIILENILLPVALFNEFTIVFALVALMFIALIVVQTLRNRSRRPAEQSDETEAAQRSVA